MVDAPWLSSRFDSRAFFYKFYLRDNYLSSFLTGATSGKDRL